MILRDEPPHVRVRGRVDVDRKVRERIVTGRQKRIVGNFFVGFAGGQAVVGPNLMLIGLVFVVSAVRSSAIGQLLEPFEVFAFVQGDRAADDRRRPAGLGNDTGIRSGARNGSSIGRAEVDRRSARGGRTATWR